MDDILGTLTELCALSVPDLPPEAWWIPALVIILLAAAAAIDTVKGIVPDPLIFCGMVGLVGCEGVMVTWPFAAHQLAWGLLAGAIIWAVNEIWFRFFKQDALGLGDAKWSMLAVTCFGGWPVLFAWGVGAVCGTLWIGGMKLARRPVKQVHFAPFLFFGLLAGLWWLRVQDN